LAQSNLGIMYANGWGVPKSDIEAYKWYNLAAAQGQSEATTRRDRIAARMTPAQLAEGQRLAAEWRPR
jgi:TPR repeat protein